MANVLTGTGQSLLDTTAYNLAVYYAFRASAIFDSFAEVRATRQSHRGASVVFTSVNDMAVNDTELDEFTDVDAESLSDAQITLTLTEFGRATISTAKLRGTSFIEFDPTAANRLAYNAARSVDLRAQKQLRNSTEVADDAAWGGSTPTLTTALVQEAAVRLRDANVPTWPDGFYRAVTTPKQGRALRAEVASNPSNTWRIPQEYGTNQMRIYRGETGEFEGFRFIENTAIQTVTDGVSAGVDGRAAHFIGRESIAKGFSMAPGFGPYPVVRPSPVTDKLWRFRPLGWYWLGNYRDFRPESSVWKFLTDDN